MAMKKVLYCGFVALVAITSYSAGFYLSQPIIGQVEAGGKGATGGTTVPTPKERLEKSPRHQEWVKVKNGAREVSCFVVYPESKEKTLAVIAIHENKGLTEWTRGVADQLAEAGYIAIAPDMLSGMGPKGGNTDAFPSEAEATKAIGKISAMPEQVNGDLQAVADYALKMPANNGKIAVSGFCWGGGQSFTFATKRPDLAAAFVFYGPPPSQDIDRIKCPVYGFYGGSDMRINATLPDAEKQMKAAGKTYEPVIYDGAGHGFMRGGEEANGKAADVKARNEGWERWKKVLKTL